MVNYSSYFSFEISMGKKNGYKLRIPGAQDGPNRQNKPVKPPQPPPESESEDSFVLDEPVGNVYLPVSSSESDNEVEKETYRVQVKQV
jgi:hypothetical protein